MHNDCAESNILSENDFISILKKERITTHFQPIISIKNPKLSAMEALTRAIGPDGQIIPAALFFSSAQRFHRTLETDRLCRSKALENFRAIQDNLPTAQEPLLFINFDTTILDQGVLGSGMLFNQSKKHHIPAERIVIEIVESAVDDTAALKEFVSFYRKLGFMIALDDVGSGHSNFDRFSIIKPDIIKVDRSIISDIHKDFYKQEIFKALVKLSRKIGSLVLAEGVESEEEVLCVLNYDADLLQGYYFARPAATWEQMTGQLGNKSIIAADKLRELRINNINGIRDQYRIYNEALSIMTSMLCRDRTETFEAKLKAAITDMSFIEAVYVLDQDGIMVTDTLMHEGMKINGSSLFHKALKGENLSSKEYFYLLMFSGLKHFVTESYTSLATGNLTQTISCVFNAGNGDKMVLCIDVQSNIDTCLCE